MVSENDILKAKDPVDKARDLIAESGDLSRGKAKKLFELPFTGLVDEIDSETLSYVFDSAVEESTVNDRIMWNGAFNSYAATMNLIKVIRKPGDFVEGSGGSYAQEVMAAPNRMGMVYALLRKHKDMSASDVQSILEIAHSTALIGLSNAARDAVFLFATDRGVSWFEVATQYDTVIDIVQRVKRPLYEHL